MAAPAAISPSPGDAPTIMSPITRSVLSDQVKDVLLQGILSGHYPPGSRIVETRVARELGVSQAPVREALRDLEALGVVESTAFQGARVRRPEKAELAEAYGVRAELESLGARLALPRLTGADLEELQGYVDEMQHAATTGNALVEARVDAAFHGRVMEIAANATLSRVWRFLEPMSRTYITFVNHRIDPREIANLHQPILNALLERDADGATAAVHRHFRMAGEMFAEVLDTAPSTDDAAGNDAGPTAAEGGPTQTMDPNLARRRLAGVSNGARRSKEHQ
jgi:DNA-binding GntR family transcriptional regulator